MLQRAEVRCEEADGGSGEVILGVGALCAMVGEVYGMDKFISEMGDLGASYLADYGQGSRILGLVECS